ncbi:unnamed protein product [Adineta steineri]|uniref:Uncharacterized protein n=1 Tax=Adineta steineri TaxID=433720 RepID=A0A819M7X0_9BILA|nr:unnamed protein product [Adineta steineri]CAF3975916.1 unnamed protein product [Adineta steineri]
MQILVDKISQLGIAKSSSSKDNKQLELLQLKQELSGKLTEMKIQDEKSLPEKIEKTKQRIKTFENDDRMEMAEKERKRLRILEEIQNLIEKIAKFSPDVSASHRDNNSSSPQRTEISSHGIVDEKIQQRSYIENLENDLTRLPCCAERTIMELLKHFAQKSSSLQEKNFLPEMLNQLHNQIKQQGLFSEDIQTFLQNLNLAIESGKNSSSMNILQEFLKKIRPINISETQRLVSKSKKAAELIRDKDIVLLVGETGSGKSTSIHFLAGSEMQEIKVEIELGKFLQHVTAVGPIHNRGLQNVTSSPFHKSETRYIAPVTIELQDVLGSHESGMIILCDAPGFGDTAGAEVDIANSVGVLEALVGAQSVKLLALSNFQNLGKRGEGIQKLAHILIKMINNIEKRLEAIVYAFTQYPKEMDINAILIDIKKRRVDSDVLLRADSALNTVLTDMIEKTEENIYQIDPVHGDRKVLIKKLRRMKGIKFPRTVFQFSMSEETRATIASHVEIDKDNINSAFKHKNNELLLYYLNDLKTLHELINQSFVRDAYESSICSISENINEYCTDKMKIFNRVLISQDGLREDDIQDYKDSIEYLRQFQMLKEHLESGLLSPETLIQNIISQLNETKTTLDDKDFYDPFVGIYLNNLLSLRKFFSQLEIYYRTSCSEFKVRFDTLVESSQKLIPKNNFKEIAEIILNIFKSSQILKDHLGEEIERAYFDIIETLLKHLNNYCEKADFLLKKNRLNADDIETLKTYMEILTSAKENSLLKDRIATYNDMLRKQMTTSNQHRLTRQSSVEFLTDLSTIHKHFTSKIIDYFDAINTRIEELFRRQKDRALDDIQRLIGDMDAIRSIPEVDSKTAGTYYRTVESINGYMKELQIEAENLVHTMDNQSGIVNYRNLSQSLSRLKNAEWINRISPGAYDNLMQRITDDLVEQACRLEGSLMKIDYGLKYPDNVFKAYDIVEKVESMSSLENAIPALEKFRNNVVQRFLQSTQAVFDRIQSTFNLQDKDVYLIKQQLKDYEETRKEYHQLHPALLHLRKYNYPDISVLNKEIEQVVEKKNIELSEVDTGLNRLDDKLKELNSVVHEYLRLSSETNESLTGKLSSMIGKKPLKKPTPAENYLNSLGYSDVDMLNREILEIKKTHSNTLKQKENLNKEFNGNIHRLESIQKEYQSLLATDRLISLEEMNVLKKQGFESLESLNEAIREKTKVIQERGKNKQTYHFSGRIDASTAESALIYLSQCEKVNQDRVRATAIDANENLRKYLSEYGSFLDQEIRNKFDLTSQIHPDSNIFQHSQELDMRLQELRSLERYANVFECIEGKDKIEYWRRIFFDYHRTLTSRIQEYANARNNQESKAQLMIAHALSCVDRFCDDSGFSTNGFGTLYSHCHKETVTQCRKIYQTILQHIANEDYANAEIALSNIKDDSLNAQDRAQIEYDVQSSLNKLINRTKSDAHWLNGKIERGDEDNRSKIQKIKENSDKVRIAVNRRRIIDLVDEQTRQSLKNFDQEMNDILSNIILRGHRSIEAFIETNSFSEAEQSMENLRLVQQELTNYCTSKNVILKTDELSDRLNGIVSDILNKHDFTDINSFAKNSPKDLLDKLIMVPPNISPRFNRAYKLMSDRIRNNFTSAISLVSEAPLHERMGKIRGLNQALCFLPEDMQVQFKGQIDELITTNANEAKVQKDNLDALLVRVQTDDHAISQLGLLAKQYKDTNMHELFQLLREQCIKNLDMYKTVVHTSDIQSAIQIFKKIVEYKKSLSSYVPEVLEVYISVSRMISKGFLDCCATLASIPSIEQTQLVEKAFQDMIIYLKFSDTFIEERAELFPASDLEKAENYLQEMSKYLKENSAKLQTALDEMNVIEVYNIIVISKKWDILLQNINRCTLKHEFIKNLSKEMKSVISYPDMISELEAFINHLKVQLNVELINDETTKFEVKRDAFFRNLMKLIDTYRSFNSKFNKILSSLSDVDRIIEELKRKIERISQQLSTKVSRIEHFTLKDTDEFRMYYNHLLSFQKHVHIPEINISHILVEVDRTISEKVISFRQEILDFHSEAAQVAHTLCRMKFLAENLPMFDTHINMEIDEVLKIYKNKQGSIGITNLTAQLEQTPVGERIISEHSCLKGEDRRKRREKMQKQDDIEYALKELKGDNISVVALRSNYKDFRKRYDSLVANNLDFFSKSDLKEPDVEVLVSQIKYIAGTVNHASNSVEWPTSFVDQIPELIANIFAVWTLQNTEHYNAMRGIRADQSYLLMPHVGQIIAIFRLLGIGYENFRTVGGHRVPGTTNISKDLVNNLVELGTGEGKSVVLAITACVFALTGLDVNCSCYSDVLSTRDKNDFTSVFRALGIEEYIEYGTFNKLCEQLLNEQCNVREKVREMTLTNQTTTVTSDTSRRKRPKVLLIDEVDVFLSDKFYGGTYTPAVCLNKEHEILELLDSIWENKNGLRRLQEVKVLPAYQACAIKYSNWMFLFDEAIKDMVAALQSFQSSTYIVQNDKIVYVEGESIVDNVVRGYDTIWAYYYEHEKGNISRNSLQDNIGIIINCGTISYAEMPHEFSYIAGVTGTLKTLAATETEILKSVYRVEKMTYIPSVYGSSNRTYNSRNDVRAVKEDEYFMEIRNEIEIERNNNRALLIFFESEEKLMAFYDFPELDSIKEHVQIIMEKVSAKDRDMYIKRAATEGRVTLLTRTFGRGTDFICRNQKLLSNGGIHVLQTFFSEEPSEEYQIMGRGARQGDRGSYRMVLCDRDLEWVLGSTWREKLTDIVGTSLYEELKKARNVLYESKCSAKHLGIQQRKKEHTATKDFMTALSSANMTIVANFLTAQNKGADLISKISRTILLMDATGSMSSLLTAAKETVCTMFERATEVLSKQKTLSSSFQMQMTVYRDYDGMKEGLLQSSSWESKPTNLRSFMTKIVATGGDDYEEAIEIGLWHAFQQSEQPEGISQVILIGDAPAKSEKAIEDDRRKYGGEVYWSKTNYKTSTHYRKELRKLKDKDIPIHTFYLDDGARENFEEIARETSGHCKSLDIHSPQGAELLTHFVTEEILRKVGGEDAAQLYKKMFVNKSFTS